MFEYERPERRIERLGDRLGRLECRVDKLEGSRQEGDDALDQLEQLLRQDQSKVKDRIHLLNKSERIRNALYLADKNRTLLVLQDLLIGFVEWSVVHDIDEDAMMVGALHLIDGPKYQRAWYDREPN